MKNINTFRKNNPLLSMQVSGRTFQYRYYKHPTGSKTLVLLTGGIGLSDLFFLHFEEFAKDFSVITFDYQMNYPDNKSLSYAIAELLKSLHVKAYLIGQSLGGVVAQIVAKHYPEVVEGLILSNTASLAKEISEEGHKCLADMIKRQEKSKRMLKFIPFLLYKKLIKKAVMKKVSAFSSDEKKLMDNLCDIMLQLLKKDYEFHMINLLIDAQNYCNMTSADFSCYKGRVLLLLSEDDNTFNQGVKDSLIALMPSPIVVTNITGGHLALLIRLEHYAETVKNFLC